ncbi:hypothetical protein N431DRAFT_390044 [Stipitochalara longipes BDJ]|nr:hypothetical protein N431DRAFT_390044 [Stipitochalara longipes BDJ]
MATMRANPRLQVGSASWIAEERTTAQQLVNAEAEEFSFSARNDVDWLNEHMAEIFSKNQVNVAEIFKTPGKLRGKTPRTIRKVNPLEARPPLSDVFSATPRGVPSPFKQAHFERPVATFQVAEDEPTQAEEEPIPSASKSTQRTQPSPPKLIHNTQDSGYHGSQADEAPYHNQPVAHQPTPKASPARVSPPKSPPKAPESIESDDDDDDTNVVILGRDSEERETTATDGSFHSAKEEQTRKLAEVIPEPEAEKPSHELEQTSHPVLESPLQNRYQPPPSPQKRSPQRQTPLKSSPPKPLPVPIEQLPQPIPVEEEEQMHDIQSPSEGSSPIRPIRKKSSFSFASLPAREPLTTKQSIGNRVSRTSHIDPSRASYFGRLTGGKSIGNIRQEDRDDDDMDIDELNGPEARDDTDSKMTRLHNKTSTQRLQDQISMLGKSQSNVRPSKSIANAAPVQPEVVQPSHLPLTHETRQKSPLRKERAPPTPGAFPEDEDSWIGPPNVVAAEPSIFSPRPQIAKSHSTDVMEGIHGKDSIGGAQFNIPKRGDQHRRSPVREPVIPERTTSTLGHIKSVSTSVLRSPKKAGSPGHKQAISVSNPNPPTISEAESTTPPKSPSRSYRGSPLKAAKDKFSSILKTSRGLFASSAAVSAEAKSTLSPVNTRVGVNHAPSFDDLVSQSSKSPTYPNLDHRHERAPDSPGKASSRKTRASTEREERRKQEEAREAKEAKEAQKMTDQLEKARMKVKEEARVFHLEKERVAAMQKEVAARKEREAQAKASHVDVPRATRSSPRKTKAQLEAEGIAAAAASVDELAGRDVEMSDASQAMPPPAIPRPKSQIGRPGAKRPLKPAKETIAKAKPPTVIRVDTGSQRGHQYHPSNSTLAASLQDSLASSQQPAPSQGLRHKASTSSIQSKASTSSFKSAATKALEAAARKKEQDELAAQRKKEAKLEVERQRAAIKEEERRKEEQQRRQEAERQKELQRERERAAAAADAKKAASRQAIEKRRLEMEKAKETRAPPPAVRPQPSGDLTHAMLQEKALPPVPAPRAELAQAKPPRMVNAPAQRPQPQEDLGRSVNSTLQNTTKAPPKRPLQQDSEDHHPRPPLQRNGPSYQHNDQQSKRRKTSQEFEDDEDMTEPQPKMTAPPIRQSSSRPKEMQTKSIFSNGYAPAPASGNLQRSTLITQHNMSQAKTTHPMDMAQVSKAPIPFAPSSNQVHNQNHKTPARPGAPNGGAKSGAKSAAKSSPRYQNGENIELPEIHTDSEDEDSADENFDAPSWTDSPALRGQLARQEAMDPATVFGQPGPLNMEEVFSKSKDRWHKFRARTSSANWTGQDRLTEDEVKRDLEGRDRVRRQGGWTYDSMV